MSRNLKLAVGIIISGAAVWWAMREVRPGEVWNALQQADYRGFVGVMLLTLFGFWLRAFRWRWLITSPKPLSLDSLYSATMIGFMANNLFPLRLGEFIRAWALGRREKLPKTTIFATVVVERVIDMITLLAILGIALLVHPISADSEAGRMTQTGATTLMAAVVLLTVLLVVLERTPKLMNAVLEKVTSPLPERWRRKALAMFQHFVDGLVLFRDLPRLLWVMALSFLMFGSFALALQVSMWAFQLPVPIYAGLLMLVVTAIGIMVPAAPGYIGTLNLAAVAGLALFGVGRDLAVPFSWFYWAAQWIPVTVVGMIYLRREGLTLRSIGQMRESAHAS